LEEANVAVSPKDVLSVSGDEQKMLAEVEVKIDERLLKEYQPGQQVTYPVMKRWRPGFITALMVKYRDQGWKVIMDSLDDGSGQELVFWTEETVSEEVLTQDA
jgi:hypothetical protein